MKRSTANASSRRFVRPPELNDNHNFIESGEDDDDATPQPARKILKKLLQNEVQKAVSELNADTRNNETKGHRAASLIPEFDPDNEDCVTVTAWLKKIDQLGEIHGWNETAKAFHLQDKLKGQARKWYNRLDDYDYSWEEWKQLLRRAFPRNRDYGNMLEELINRKKMPSETMTKYYQDKIAMCFRCKLSDNAAVSCIIRGLPSSLQANARAYQCERPEELYEGFLSALDDYQPAASVGTRVPLKDNAQNFRSFERKSAPTLVNPDVVPCPRCKKTGHILRNCPHPDMRTCFKCGKQGHIATRCTSTMKIATTGEVKEIKLLQNFNSIYEKMSKINGIYVKSYIDTGSQVNVLSTHVSNLLNLEVIPTDVVLKGFSGVHLKSRGQVAFQLEVESLSIHCEAHLTEVDMGRINLIIGQPIINSKGMSLVVNKGLAVLKRDIDATEPMEQMDVIEERIRFKVITTCKESLPPGTSIIKVKVLDNEENNDIVTAPQHYDLQGISYSIPATLLRGSMGYIKVVNVGSQNVTWKQGDVLTRADSCNAPPPADVQDGRM